MQGEHKMKNDQAALVTRVTTFKLTQESLNSLAKITNDLKKSTGINISQSKIIDLMIKQSVGKAWKIDLELKT